MCIHKQELTELGKVGCCMWTFTLTYDIYEFLFFKTDIYHRILRFKNYTVAMVNKSLLPLKFRVPFMGEV